MDPAVEKLQDYVQRLEKVVVAFEGLQGKVPAGVASATSGRATPSSSASKPAAGSVGSFQQIINESVLKAVQIANSINTDGLILPDSYRNEIVECTNLVKEAFEAELKIVDAMSKCKPPQQAELQKLVEPLVKIINNAAQRTEGKRTDPYNHQKTVAEFMQCFTWVGLPPGGEKPSLHVNQAWQGAEFYGNKILKEFKTKDAKHVDWVNALKEVANELKTYLTTYHSKEPKWNPEGTSVSEFLGSEPPPPGPPIEKPKKEVTPPTPLKSTAYWQPPEKKDAPSGEAFSEMKKGLKKVVNNPLPKGDSTQSQFQSPKLKSVTPRAKQPRKELEMERRWVVESFTDNKEIIVDQTSPKQTVYIFQCQGCVIQIKGKVNAITIDQCKKTGVVFEEVVSLVEVISCARTDIQCTNRLSTITMDKSDECKLYIPATSMDVGITTAKSSSITVIATKEGADEDPIEESIPYQFLSTFKDGKLVTVPAEHTGSA